MDNLKPVVLIVHGAWHSPEYFITLSQLLKVRGIESVCPELPSCAEPKSKGHRSLTHFDDAEVIRAELRKLIEEEQRQVVVACHSYGGCVGGEAVSEEFGWRYRAIEKKKGGVVALFFFSAYLVPRAESGAKVANSPKWHSLTPPFVHVHPLEGLTTAKHADKYFYNDLDAEAQEYWMTKLRPMSIGAMLKDVKYEAYRYHPTTYMYCTNDQALPIELQRSMVNKVKESVAWIREVECDASHSPFLSQPQRLADELVQATEVFKV